MRRVPTASLVLLAAVAALAWLAAAPASAHRSGCHSAHSCPSDHHTYVWYDSSGRGWDCAEPGASEYDPSRDTTTIVYQGLTYYCRAAAGQSPPPPPATTTTTTTSTVPPATTTTPGTTVPAAAACGVERWTVKTLQDRPTLLPVKATTVGYLVRLPAPASLPKTRLPFERRVFKVTAAVVLVRHEADSDFHLVLKAGADRMIAEAPLPACVPKAAPARRKQMAVVRAAVRVCSKAVVTGVAFFDFKHGQTGVARNAIELHPILGFRCLT